MNQDAGDGVRVGETGMAEGAAAVARLEHADPGIDARNRFASPVPTHRMDGIGLRDGDVADARARLVLEDRLPCRAAIVRLPDAAGREGGVDAPLRSDVGDGDVGRAAADVVGPRDCQGTVRDGDDCAIDV